MTLGVGSAGRLGAYSRLSYTPSRLLGKPGLSGVVGVLGQVNSDCSWLRLVLGPAGTRYPNLTTMQPASRCEA